MKAVCFGALNIDYTYRMPHFIQKGETLQTEGLHIYCGGKGLNQSIALARAGVNVYHAGAVGEDGGMLIEQLLEAGVRTDFVKVLADVRTGHAIIQNDRAGDNCIFLYGGANQAITCDQVDQVLGHFERGDYLVLQNEISQIPYIVEKAHGIGMKLMLNPSPMNDSIFQIPLEYIDYFILNEIEILQLLNLKECSDGKEIAEIFRKRYPKAALILTLGARGSIYADQAHFYQQKAYPAEAKDTTAAGDTFTGFFLGGIINGLSVPRAMDQAAKAAAIAVTRPGASSSIPKLTDIMKWTWR